MRDTGACLQKVREEERGQREYAVAAVSSAHSVEISRLREEKEALSSQVVHSPPPHALTCSSQIDRAFS